MTEPLTAGTVSAFARMTDALVRDMKRFQRAVTAVRELHRSHPLDPNRAHPMDGKCRECRKPWPCPTIGALNSGLHWNGREEGEAATAAGGQSHG